MGTAYLLTEEAVSSGAIQPGFQSAAVEAESTVLLETSPGHATRCVDSEFVQTFSDERRRLTETGVSSAGGVGRSWSCSTSAGSGSPARGSGGTATRWPRSTRRSSAGKGCS